MEKIFLGLIVFSMILYVCAALLSLWLQRLVTVQKTGCFERVEKSVLRGLEKPMTL